MNFLPLVLIFHTLLIAVLRLRKNGFIKQFFLGATRNLDTLSFYTSISATAAVLLVYSLAHFLSLTFSRIKAKALHCLLPYFFDSLSNRVNSLSQLLNSSVNFRRCAIAPSNDFTACCTVLASSFSFERLNRGVGISHCINFFANLSCSLPKILQSLGLFC